MIATAEPAMDQLKNLRNDAACARPSARADTDNERKVTCSLAKFGRPSASLATTTLADLRRCTPWLWACCGAASIARRLHHPAEDPGANALSDILRRSAQCTRCGRKGATIQRQDGVGCRRRSRSGRGALSKPRVGRRHLQTGLLV